jgi:hypothetical protein
VSRPALVEGEMPGLLRDVRYHDHAPEFGYDLGEPW